MPLPSSRARIALALTLLACARVALEGVRLWDWPERTWQWEEAYNAAEAWVLVRGGLWRALLPLQYKSFCGGCTVLSLAAAPGMAIWGDSLLAWKIVPILWSALAVPIGWLAGTRRVGPAAGWLLAVLLAVPAPGVADLSLLGFGNHQESVVLVLAALAAQGPLARGLWIGLGVWFARITLWAAVPLAVAAAWEIRREPRALARLVGGAVLGYAPALVPAGAGDQGAYDLSLAANFFADGLGAGLARLRELAPPRLGWALFPKDPRDDLYAGLVLGAAGGGLVALLAFRRWLFAALPAAWLFSWAASGFDIPRAGAGSPALQQRYHAPWLFLLDLLAALGAGALWARGGWRRGLGVVLVLAPLGARVGGWTYALRAYDEDEAVLRYRAAHLPSFVGVAARKLPTDVLVAAHSDDPRLEGALRVMEGWSRTLRQDVPLASLQPAVIEGVAMTWEGDVSSLTAEQRVAWARGRAIRQAFLTAMPPLNAPIAPTVASAAQRACASGDLATLTEEPCPGCGRSCNLVGGLVLLNLCGAMRKDVPAARLSTCLAKGVDGVESPGAVLYGAAFFWQGPLRDPKAAVAIAKALPVGADGWRAGLEHPLAGLDRPPGAAAFFRGERQGGDPRDAVPRDAASGQAK